MWFLYPNTGTRDLDLALVAIARWGFAFPAALDRPEPVAVNLGRAAPVSIQPVPRRP
jgi:hypothetical protein